MPAIGFAAKRIAGVPYDKKARELPDREAIYSLLRQCGVQIVSFNDWKRLDDVEVARGERRGAPRDKIVDIEAMLEVLAQH